MIRNIFKILFLVVTIILSVSVFAEDLGGSVLGNDVEDLLSKVKDNEENSPYLNNKESAQIENLKTNDESPILPDTLNHSHIKNLKPENEFKDIGYTVPGTFEKQENYLEIDKENYTRKLKNHSSSAFNLTYFKDNFNYESPNNVIARTISQGYKHFQAGYLLIRSDSYFWQTNYFNFHWSLGTGLSYNSGKGIFIDGFQSDAQFRLWAIPLDLGLGFDVPISHWIKLSATAGPSALALIQNRSDLTEHETGKNKLQIGVGQFANAQFKFNLTAFNGENAYEVFTSNQITNMYLNLELRYQNYSHYLEAIKVSGTSIGGGFTFEFL